MSMSNYEIVIKIDIQKTGNAASNEVNKGNDGSFRIVIPKASAQSIDICEKSLLNANYPAIRQALSRHLSAISKEEADTFIVGSLKKIQQNTM